MRPRFDNRAELIGILDDEFAARTLDEWRDILKPLSGAWGLQQKAGELVGRPGGGRQRLHPDGDHDGRCRHTGCPPTPSSSTNNTWSPSGAPEHGQHTEEILMDAGMDWDDIERYKEQGAIL